MWAGGHKYFFRGGSPLKIFMLQPPSSHYDNLCNLISATLRLCACVASRIFLQFSASIVFTSCYHHSSIFRLLPYLHPLRLDFIIRTLSFHLHAPSRAKNMNFYRFGVSSSRPLSRARHMNCNM